MSVMTCTRKLTFSAGHRVYGHEGGCAHLHGHNYTVFITAEASWSLDPLGRVIDFAVLKERIGGWINAAWDHGFLLFCDDIGGLRALDAASAADGFPHKRFVLPVNPTAENLAGYLLALAPELLVGTNVRVTRVRVWETENCYADAERTGD